MDGVLMGFASSIYEAFGFVERCLRQTASVLSVYRTNLLSICLSISSVHVLGDFNFKGIDWPDRLNKSGSALSQSEGQMLIDILNDHGFVTAGAFLYSRKKNFLPGQFQDIHSLNNLSNHDIVALMVVFSRIKKPLRKVYLYQKGDYESMRKDAFEFGKEMYFNGYPDTRSVQENFNG